MRKSIFAKYFTIVAAIACVSIIIFSSIVLLSSRNQWIENKNTLLSKNVRTISAILSDPASYYEFDPQQTYGTIDAISEIIDSTIFVVDENGRCYYSAGNQNYSPEIGEYLDNDIIAKSTKQKFVQTSTLNGALDEQCFVVGFPIVANDVQIGAVFASVPMNQSKAYFAQIFKIIVYAALIVIIIAFLVTYIASLKMTKPLRQMAQVVKRIENGDLSARIPYDRHDEIGLLADSINKMLGSISELEMMRRNFISSVSHELKMKLEST